MVLKIKVFDSDEIVIIDSKQQSISLVLHITGWIDVCHHLSLFSVYAITVPVIKFNELTVYEEKSLCYRPLYFW